MHAILVEDAELELHSDEDNLIEHRWFPSGTVFQGESIYTKSPLGHFKARHDGGIIYIPQIILKLCQTEE